MEEKKSLPSLWLGLIGGFALILLAIFAVRLLSLLTSPVPDEGAARALERTEAHAKLLAENERRLTTYAWFDKEKGQVQIPIAAAMELALAELNSGSPTPAGPVDPLAVVPVEVVEVVEEVATETVDGTAEVIKPNEPATQPAPANTQP